MIKISLIACKIFINRPGIFWEIPDKQEKAIKRIPEKEIIFNRYYGGEMDKQELTALVKRLLLEKKLRGWFTVQMEFMVLFREPHKSA